MMTITEQLILKLGKEKDFKKKDLAVKLSISRVTLDRKMKDNDWTEEDLFKLEKLGIR